MEMEEAEYCLGRLEAVGHIYKDNGEYVVAAVGEKYVHELGIDRLVEKIRKSVDVK
jgi:hypothetical protein